MVWSIEAIHDMERFAAVRGEWNDLLERGRSNNIFLTHEWLSTWWEQFGARRRLEIILVRSDGRLIAAAPLMETREFVCGVPFRVLNFIGDGQADRLDFVQAPGYTVASTQIYRHLTDAGHRWRAIRLNQAPADAHCVQALAHLPPSNGLTVQRRTTSACPYLPLPSSWEACCRQLKKNLLQQLRSRERKAARAGTVTFERWTSSDDDAALLARAAAIDAKGWKGRQGCGVFSTPQQFAFHRQLSRALIHNGWFDLAFLRLNGADIAYIYGFRKDRTYFFYTTGFDEAYAPLSPGTLLFSRLMQALIGEGITEFDFLRGNDAYKTRWTGLRRDILSVSIARRSRLTRAAAPLVHVAQSVLAGLKARPAHERDGAAAHHPGQQDRRPASGETAYTVEAIRDADQFAAMRGEWSALLEASRTHNIFLTHEWLSTWWELFGATRSLLILLVRANGHLVAAAPLMIGSVPFCGLPFRAIEFIGSGQADRVNLVVLPDHVHKALAALVAYLADHGQQWQLIKLDQVPADADWVSALEQVLPKGAYTIHRRVVSICPYLPLGPTWDDCKQHVKPKLRENIRRHERRLSKLGSLTFERWTSPEDAAPLFARAAAVDAKGWKGQQGLGILTDPVQHDFHVRLSRYLVKNGWFDLSFLRHNDADIAYEYGFRQGRTFLGYNTAYDPAYAPFSPGTILMGHLVAELAREGLTELDLLRGGDAYKSDWTPYYRENLAITIMKRSWVTPFISFWLSKGRPAYGQMKRRLRQAIAGATRAK